MPDYFIRTELLLGHDAVEDLGHKKVAVFGVGGVGGFVVEALARSGVGKIVLIDKDDVSVSNINRQIIATIDTIGRPKVDVMKERILKINPDIQVETLKMFYIPSEEQNELKWDWDYTVDAIDTMTAKIALVQECDKRGIPLIASMGAGNKLDPTKFRVDDIYNTSVDPMAKIIRSKLRKLGINSLKVVYSTETPIKPYVGKELKGDRPAPGSIAFVPSVVGLIIAGEVIKDLTGVNKR